MGARAGGPVRLRARQTFAGRPRVPRVRELGRRPRWFSAPITCVALSSVPWESSRGIPPGVSASRALGSRTSLVASLVGFVL